MEFFNIKPVEVKHVNVKPRSIKILLSLWIITCFCLSIHCWNYYVEFFIADYSSGTFTTNVLLFIAGNVFLIITIIIIYNIVEIKKWSWLVSVVFSSFFLFFYLHILFQNIILFYVRQNYHDKFFTSLNYAVYIYTLLVLPVVLILILILLFKPSVKEYFNQT